MIDARETLGTMARTVFALNGKLLRVADQLAAPAGLTAVRWQVLGAVLEQPLTQAEIARKRGITRQSVQRTCTQLIEDGLVENIPNPSHRKAMLVHPTEQGLIAISRIKPQHTVFAEALADKLGAEKMREISSALKELNTALAELEEQ